MKLGVDVYSVRSQPWNAFEHLDYADSLGVDIVHFSEWRFFESLEPAYLHEVKAHADSLGIELEVGMGVICPISSHFRSAAGPAIAQLRETMRVATEIGSPSVRVVAFSVDDRRADRPFSEYIAATVDVCKAVRDEALDRGLKIAIENHNGDLHGRELAAMIERAGPEYVGACIDTGNALVALESPFVTLEHLAPYVATSHIRDTAVWRHRRGVAVQWVAMGDGAIDFTAWTRRYQELCPEAPFTLEIITGGLPRFIDYLEPDVWTLYPDTPAAEFAQFLGLMEASAPFAGPMLTASRERNYPPEYAGALVAQQRVDLERSVRYCQDVLGLGERMTST